MWWLSGQIRDNRTGVAGDDAKLWLECSRCGCVSRVCSRSDAIANGFLTRKLHRDEDRRPLLFIAEILEADDADYHEIQG